ncbi:MAG: PIG-L family deacetylase [Ardenticatenia bacterium]|nr:MAG: PIG-L family deacetylase [Ardenticatenia bacterium]
MGGDVRPTLIVVTAHPDDEAFGFGGTLARYGWQRVRTVLVTLTDGAAGQTGGLVPQANLAARRQAELYHSARILGVSHVEQWGAPDGALNTVPPEPLVARLLALFRAERPAVIATFGPEGGGNQHPDHQAASALVTAAWRRWREDAPQTRLAYITVAPSVAEQSDIPYSHAHVRVDISAALAVKRAAFYAHRTQKGDRAYYEAYQQAQGPFEWFHLVDETPPARWNDLFTNLPVQPKEAPITFLAEESE